MSFVDRLDAQGARRAAATKQTATTTKKRRVDPKQRTASRLYNLTLDTHALRQQIQQLQQHRAILYARALHTRRCDGDDTLVRTACEYVRLFRHGVRHTRGRDDTQQIAFLERITHERLSLGLTAFGRAMLLEQWRRYTQYFAVRENVFHSIRVIARDEASGVVVVRADGVIYGSFTRQAIELVFPRVLDDAELTQALLGHELVAPGSMTFYFNRDGLMVRHDSETDFVATLGVLRRAAGILQSANIAEEGMLDGPLTPVRGVPLVRR